MATVDISFDTKTKALVVSIDGEAVPDVQHVHIGRSWDWDGDDDDACICINTSTKDEENDIRHYHNMSASKKYAERGEVPSKRFEGFVEKPRKGLVLQNAIAAYFGR